MKLSDVALGLHLGLVVLLLSMFGILHNSVYIEVPHEAIEIIGICTIISLLFFIPGILLYDIIFPEEEE